TSLLALTAAATTPPAAVSRASPSATAEPAALPRASAGTTAGPEPTAVARRDVRALVIVTLPRVRLPGVLRATIRPFRRVFRRLLARLVRGLAGLLDGFRDLVDVAHQGTDLQVVRLRNRSPADVLLAFSGDLRGGRRQGHAGFSADGLRQPIRDGQLAPAPSGLCSLGAERRRRIRGALARGIELVGEAIGDFL